MKVYNHINLPVCYKIWLRRSRIKTGAVGKKPYKSGAVNIYKSVQLAIKSQLRFEKNILANHAMLIRQICQNFIFYDTVHVPE